MQSSPPDDAITFWLRALEGGDAAVAQKLWQQFSQRLVRLARRQLSNQDRAVADEEDVALSAFQSFCRGAKEGRFHQLDDRHDLWRLLVTITVRKVLYRIRSAQRLKRGGPRGAQIDAAELDQMFSREPNPELAAEVAEQCRFLLNLLPSRELVQLVLWKLEGFTNQEVAQRWGRSERTVERKLALVRKVWTKSMPHDNRSANASN